jgi:hypothetical protein
MGGGAVRPHRHQRLTHGAAIGAPHPKHPRGQPYQQEPYPPYPQNGSWQTPPGSPPTNGYPQPTRQQPWPPLPPAATKKRRKAWPWIVGGLVALLLIMIVGTAGSKGTSASTASTSTPSANSGSRLSPEPAAAAPAAPQPAKTPKAITARDWAKIAKDPGSHVGEAIIVYGEVTQFDAATGTPGVSGQR